MSLQNIRGLRPWRTLAFAALAAVVLPVALWAQTPSLADLAKKEQERKKTAGTADKTYTNKDLPKTVPGAGGTATAPATADAAATPAAQDATPATEQKAPENEKNEDYWRGRVADVREAIRRGEMFIEALQSRINALSTDFVNRDDPFQRAQIGEDRQKTLAELDRVKNEIAKLNKDLDDIQEEARKAGVPPGWLR